MELEREKGITIKAQTARLRYQLKEEESYILNLIDTPGHVDFSYEVSRSLAACEGALLVVDSSQGVEAQTLANTYLALQHDLVLIPVINKIDLAQSNPQLVFQQLENILGFKRDEALLTSAKKGIGIDEVIRAIIERIPSPQGERLLFLTPGLILIEVWLFWSEFSRVWFAAASKLSSCPVGLSTM